MARELSRQFRTRSIAKTYLALVVHGESGLGNVAWTAADGPSGARTGVITNPLRVDDDGRVRAGVRPPSANFEREINMLTTINDHDQVQVGPGADLEPARELVGIVGGKVKAARTAWEVLASSVSGFFPLSRINGW
jgi:hypothetical protein